MVVHHKNQDYDLEFIIANVKTEPILGSQASVVLGLLKRIYSVNNKSSSLLTTASSAPTNTTQCGLSEAILSEYGDLFEGIGCVKNVTHHISLHEDASPVIYPPRKVPEALKPKLHQELDRM